MAARTYNYGEDTGESTTTSTTFQDKVSVSQAIEDNETWYAFAHSRINSSSTSTGQNPESRLFKSTATTDEFQLHDAQTLGANSEFQITGGIGITAFGESPGTHTWKVQYRNEFSAATTKIQKARLFLMRKETGDEDATAATRTTTTSSTFQDKTTLTFTPSTTQDYVIYAAATFDYSAAGTSTGEITLDIDGTDYETGGRTGSSAAVGNLWFWGAVIKANLTNASHTIKIQFRSASGVSTIGIQDARIIVIPASNQDNIYYQEDQSRSTTTSSTLQTKSDLTITNPPTSDYFVVGRAVKDTDNDLTEDAIVRIENASTDLVESNQQIEESTSDDANDYDKLTVWAIYKVEISASTNFYTKYKNASGVDETGIQGSAIAVIQLQASPPATPGDSTGRMTANPFFWGP